MTNHEALTQVREPDAMLIAAAPELLELLKEVINCDDLTGWCGPEASPICDRIYEILKRFA